MKQYRPVMNLVFLTFCFSLATAYAGVIVGNGDDGADLEGATPITSGPILDAQKKTQVLIQSLGLKGVRGLGTLEDEVMKSALYLAPADRSANLSQDQGPFHADMRGLVYARTLPTAHASTRFYPVAQQLNADQLVALHIHEALHRALPEAIREDEAKVSELTLAITAPNGTRDQVERSMDRVYPEKMAVASASASVAEPLPTDPSFREFQTPSNVGYSLRNFIQEANTASIPLTRMHSINSYLYPFGGATSPFGMGVEMAFVETQSGLLSGPLGISARLRLWSRRSFDIGLWTAIYLNTLSAEEMKNSPFGRDIATLGVSMRKAFKNGYVENLISISTGGSSSQKIGLVPYDYSYGEVIQVKVRAGLKLWQISMGGFGEIHLADHFRVSGGAFNYDSGRYRIVSAGPEINLTLDNVQLGVQGRFLVGSTQSANFDYLGNLLGIGTANGSIGATASILF